MNFSCTNIYRFLFERTADDVKKKKNGGDGGGGGERESHKEVFVTKTES